MRAGIVLVSVSLGALGLVSARALTVGTQGSSGGGPAATSAARAPGAVYRAGAVEPDLFHPEHQPGADGKRPALPGPAFGGRATIHLERMPKSLNNVLENEGAIRRMLLELHETLLLRDWETLELAPDLAKAWWVEDAIHLKPGKARGLPEEVAIGGETIVAGVATPSEKRVDYGARLTRRTPDGRYVDVSGSVPLDDVARIERGTVITLVLRDDVRWHDGHAFDARDVVFSLELYANPLVDCGQRRSQFDKIVRVHAIDAHTVRVWFDQQSYYSLTALGTELTILPAHLYDLVHPDNADGNAKRAKALAWKPDEKERAEYINKNPHNRDWVGLGPYRMKRFDEEGVLAERWTGYFDPAHAGYLDTLFWRFIPDDAAAFQALLNGELDYFGRMSADDYFGASTQSETFTKHLYKGHFYSGNYWFTAWNLRRPMLADVRVRRAIAQAFDFEGFRQSAYKGLADQVTGPWIPAKPEYNQDVKPYPRDPDHARKLLEEAGWIDRDGDGVVDKDGVAFELELVSDSGNAVSKAFAAKLQEDLARIGIRMRFTALDAKAVNQRKLARDFDGIALGWALTWENDPEQVWHSKWAPIEKGGSNFAGFADPACDELIEKGQKELDTAKRAAIWRELHARIYAEQPYLFAYSPPRKFGLNRALRGVQLVLMDPNYVLRRWYYAAGTPGTRATLETK